MALNGIESYRIFIEPEWKVPCLILAVASGLSLGHEGLGTKMRQGCATCWLWIASGSNGTGMTCEANSLDWAKVQWCMLAFVGPMFCPVLRFRWFDVSCFWDPSMHSV
jgi:hypothetical protein